MAKREIRFNSDTLAQHVCLKGHNSSVVFYDDADRVQFLEALEKACEEYEVDLLVYTLMDNHVHLILHGDVEQFQYVFESLGASYARTFNQKAGGSGSLWTSRYFAGAIQSPEQFLRAAAYIFHNPGRAGICENPQDYDWSNFSELLAGEGKNATKIIDELVNVEKLIDYTLSEKSRNMTNREAMELGLVERKKVLDADLCIILNKYIEPQQRKKIDKLGKDIQMKMVKEMWDYGGNVYQISRVTHLRRYLIEKAIGKL